MFTISIFGRTYQVSKALFLTLVIIPVFTVFVIAVIGLFQFSKAITGEYYAALIFLILTGTLTINGQVHSVIPQSIHDTKLWKVCIFLVAVLCFGYGAYWLFGN